MLALRCCPVLHCLCVCLCVFMQMFVIKNLDTGLQMRIDDFDKIANLATDERQVRREHSAAVHPLQDE